MLYDLDERDVRIVSSTIDYLMKSGIPRNNITLAVCKLVDEYDASTSGSCFENTAIKDVTKGEYISRRLLGLMQ